MKPKTRGLVLAACLGLAAGLIALGIGLEQPGEVLAKAARICLECVGIG